MNLNKGVHVTINCFETLDKVKCPSKVISHPVWIWDLESLARNSYIGTDVITLSHKIDSTDLSKDYFCLFQHPCQIGGIELVILKRIIN